MNDMQSKRLFRSRTDRVVAGVCGGLGEYFDLDPIFFRILFFLLTIGGGLGLLLYLFMVIAIPKEEIVEKNNGSQGDGFPKNTSDFGQRAKDLASEIKEQQSWLSGKKNLLGLIIIIVGLLLLAGELFDRQFFRWDILFAAFVICLGIIILSKDKK